MIEKVLKQLAKSIKRDEFFDILGREFKDKIYSKYESEINDEVANDILMNKVLNEIFKIDLSGSLKECKPLDFTMPNEFKEYLGALEEEFILEFLNMYYFNRCTMNFSEIIETFPKQLSLENIDFNEDKRYKTILSDFKSKSFKKCTFSCKDIKIEKKISFNDCLFKNEDDFINIEIYSNIELLDDSVIFKNCTFENDLKLKALNTINVDLFYGGNFKSINIENIHLERDLFKISIKPEIKKYQTIEGNLIIRNCIFENEFKLKDCKEINKLDLNNTVFNNKCKIVECKIDDANFQQTKFKDLVGFDSTEIEKTNFRNTRFGKLARFNKTKFLENVDFEYSYFQEHSIFTNCIFKEELNLKKAFFAIPGNFLDINIEEIKNKNSDDTEIKTLKHNLILKNRETARIIKDSFEQQNNIIEANRFYVFEMEQREKELKKKEKKSFNDYLEHFVFKIHGLASNHSQEWLLPLLLIIIVGLSYSFFSFSSLNVNEHEKLLDAINLYKTSQWQVYLQWIFIFLSVSSFFIAMFYPKELSLVYVFISLTITSFYIGYTKDICFIFLAYNINPFSIMTSNDILSGGTLFFKIIIAYLIYQLIISIRQNTRRK